MIETTIFKNDVFKNSDVIKEYLEIYNLKVLLIANEITINSKKTHFHVLIDNDYDEIPKDLENVFIFRPVRNLHKTVTYFIKEGKYKVYNDFVVPDYRNYIDEDELIKDLENGLDYLSLFKKYGKAIRSYTYLIKLIKEENFKIKK